MRPSAYDVAGDRVRPARRRGAQHDAVGIGPVAADMPSRSADEPFGAIRRRGLARLLATHTAAERAISRPHDAPDNRSRHAAGTTTRPSTC
jgi:hypothetical protein